MKLFSISIFFFALVIAGCKSPEKMENKITVQIVEKDIQEHLPIGSSKADVIAFLDQRKYPHSWLQNGVIGQFGSPNFPSEEALIPDVRTEGHLFKVIVSIQMEFVFDEGGSKLIDYSVHEVYKGP